MQQPSFTATFHQDTATQKMESSTRHQEDRLMAIDDTQKIGFMKKNMSINSNFEAKTPNEGGLTKAINNFQNMRFLAG